MTTKRETYTTDDCDDAFVRDFLPYKGSPDPYVVWRAAWNSATTEQRKKLAGELRVEMELDGFGCACDPKVQCGTCKARTVLFKVLTPIIKRLEA